MRRSMTALHGDGTYLACSVGNGFSICRILFNSIVAVTGSVARHDDNGVFVLIYILKTRIGWLSSEKQW